MAAKKEKPKSATGLNKIKTSSTTVKTISLKSRLNTLFYNKTFLFSMSIAIFITTVSLGCYIVFGIDRGPEPELPEENAVSEVDNPETDQGYEPAGNEPEVAEQEENNNVEEQEEEKELLSPYSGLPLNGDDLLKRPFALMMDNFPAARPQYGIQNAAYVYEIVAEGGITRLLAIFHHYFPGDIGPIRSVRHYYAYFSRENDAIMAHCGGSPVGMKTLHSAGYDHIDEHKFSSTYFRDKSRRAPHNLFTSLERLIKTAKKQKIYRDSTVDVYFDFVLHEKEDTGKIQEVRIPFDRSNIVSYQLDKKKNNYRRFINNEKHSDGMSGKQIRVKNIIVQYAEYGFISSVHRDYKIVGNGEGLLIHNGNVHNIKWSKEGYDKATEYFYEDGSPIRLYPGNTWFHILTPRNKVTTK